MLAQLFLLIQVILRAFGLWDQFLSYSDGVREKERIERDAARNKAVDEQSNAKDEGEYDRAQDDIANSKP